jgi:hypothetical protein
MGYARSRDESVAVHKNFLMPGTVPRDFKFTFFGGSGTICLPHRFCFSSYKIIKLNSYLLTKHNISAKKSHLNHPFYHHRNGAATFKAPAKNDIVARLQVELSFTGPGSRAG